MSDTPETVKQIPPADVIFLASEQASDLPNNELWTRAELRDFIIEAIMLDRSRRPSSEAGKGQALLREALVWYGDEAASLAKALGSVSMAEALSMNNADRNRIEAVLTVLGLDAGKRARTALQPGHKP